MKMLTKLEELILLSVLRLGENAYGTTVFKHIRRVTGKRISLGGVYFPLERLTNKGFLSSYIGEANEKRRGLSKRYYKITAKGIKALDEIKRVNDIMWEGYPDFAFSTGKNI
jgi:DNA-binding PadR family transcriptional regulator